MTASVDGNSSKCPIFCPVHTLQIIGAISFESWICLIFWVRANPKYVLNFAKGRDLEWKCTFFSKGSLE